MSQAESSKISPRAARIFFVCENYSIPLKNLKKIIKKHYSKGALQIQSRPTLRPEGVEDVLTIASSFSKHTVFCISGCVASMAQIKLMPHVLEFSGNHLTGVALHNCKFSQHGMLYGVSSHVDAQLILNQMDDILNHISTHYTYSETAEEAVIVHVAVPFHQNYVKHQTFEKILSRLRNHGIKNEKKKTQTFSSLPTIFHNFSAPELKTDTHTRFICNSVFKKKSLAFKEQCFCPKVFKKIIRSFAAHKKIPQESWKNFIEESQKCTKALTLEESSSGLLMPCLSSVKKLPNGNSRPIDEKIHISEGRAVASAGFNNLTSDRAQTSVDEELQGHLITTQNIEMLMQCPKLYKFYIPPQVMVDCMGSKIISEAMQRYVSKRMDMQNTPKTFRRISQKIKEDTSETGAAVSNKTFLKEVLAFKSQHQL